MSTSYAQAEDQRGTFDAFTAADHVSGPYDRTPRYNKDPPYN